MVTDGTNSEALNEFAFNSNADFSPLRDFLAIIRCKQYFLDFRLFENALRPHCDDKFTYFIKISQLLH